MHLYLMITLLFAINAQGQEKANDTLFFKFDKSYITESDLTFYLKDTNHNEIFYFRGTQLLNDLKPKKILCLKEMIRQPKFYNKSKAQKLNTYELIIYFSDKITYLVKEKNGKKEFINIEPVLAIAD
ncbi:hypothetical protein IR010_17805 [Flavobacterium sp. MR2016-29]|uniref:hypothetical protein n=1 Tax=Flavobacterium sp. MR2016-29 TaxID=2783795 RepID=UPI00188CD2BF|nr:hypothetical protein [Flavobacterium sp. MR2016-29]MBF4494405.1 hypothetical protein [Flavobacterium sp. MR2016-29]